MFVEIMPTSSRHIRCSIESRRYSRLVRFATSLFPNGRLLALWKFLARWYCISMRVSQIRCQGKYFREFVWMIINQLYIGSIVTFWSQWVSSKNRLVHTHFITPKQRVWAVSLFRSWEFLLVSTLIVPADVYSNVRYQGFSGFFGYCIREVLLYLQQF